jgi:hypothetical protein
LPGRNIIDFAYAVPTSATWRSARQDQQVSPLVSELNNDDESVISKGRRRRPPPGIAGHDQPRNAIAAPPHRCAQYAGLGRRIVDALPARPHPIFRWLTGALPRPRASIRRDVGVTAGYGRPTSRARYRLQGARGNASQLAELVRVKRQPSNARCLSSARPATRSIRGINTDLPVHFAQRRRRSDGASSGSSHAGGISAIRSRVLKDFEDTPDRWIRPALGPRRRDRAALPRALRCRLSASRNARRVQQVIAERRNITISV